MSIDHLLATTKSGVETELTGREGFIVDKDEVLIRRGRTDNRPFDR